MGSQMETINLNSYFNYRQFNYFPPKATTDAQAKKLNLSLIFGQQTLSYAFLANDSLIKDFGEPDIESRPNNF